HVADAVVASSAGADVATAIGIRAAARATAEIRAVRLPGRADQFTTAPAPIRWAAASVAVGIDAAEAAVLALPRVVRAGLVAAIGSGDIGGGRLAQPQCPEETAGRCPQGGPAGRARA
ncbi:MAG: hypothetical protein WBD22_05500, partial [Pyrinomonadaceae bacterium]